MEAVEKKKPGRPKKVAPIAESTADARMTGAAELGNVDIRNVSVASRKRVSLADPQFDPFKAHKTDPKMYYRAINTRTHNVRKREAEGYKVIPGTEYGDLILAKMPKEDREDRESYVKEKTENQKAAAVAQFQEEAAKGKIETFTTDGG